MGSSTKGVAVAEVEQVAESRSEVEGCECDSRSQGSPVHAVHSNW